MPEARILSSADMRVGLTAEFERAVGPDDVSAFATLSGDHNPLHVDPEYARTTNYGREIAHGAFQVALASTMAGMYLPGRNVVVGSYHSRFPVPLFIPAVIRVHGEITSWDAVANLGMLRVTIVDTRRSALTAEILVAFGLHELRTVSPSPAPVSTDEDAAGRPLVIVTGAGGAVGLELVSGLADSFRILALCRSQIPAALSNLPGVSALTCDLETSDWETTLDAILSGAMPYAIVHAAWPGFPKGSLLDTDPAITARQVEFGSLVTIRLARWLCRKAGDRACLVVLSTTAASLKPLLSLSAYSLGKAALEHTVRLLAPELARRGITINAVVPSLMPIGMNGALTARALLTETARIPAGRLCSPRDVIAAVKYLLSEDAAFVTGQILPLTGGQL
jgi:NAD(P)-dependent dehydrogenase (short-subunit alcohol dehydrogenase family)/acyl dehydratase